MNTNVADIIEKTTAQTVGGLLIGGAIDSIFPSPASAITKGHGIKELAIVLVQMGALGILTSINYGFLARCGLNADGLLNIPFLISLIATQSSLFNHLQQIWQVLMSLLKSTYLGKMPASNDNPAKAGYQAVCHNDDNVDVPVNGGHESMPNDLRAM